MGLRCHLSFGSHFHLEAYIKQKEKKQAGCPEEGQSCAVPGPAQFPASPPGRPTDPLSVHTFPCTLTSVSLAAANITGEQLVSRQTGSKASAHITLRRKGSAQPGESGSEQGRHRLGGGGRVGAPLARAACFRGPAALCPAAVTGGASAQIALPG